MSVFDFFKKNNSNQNLGNNLNNNIGLDKKFIQILNIIPLGVIIYDQNFKIIYINNLIQKIFQIDSNLILNKQIKVSDVQNEDLKRFVQVIFPSLAPVFALRSEEGKDPMIEDISFYDPDLFLRVYSSKIYNESGSIEFFIKMIYDQTAEINLLKSKDEFITIASHQLRTPLNELSWAIEVVASDNSLQPNTKEILEHSLLSVKRLSNLVENILNISKIEEGKMSYNFEPVDFIEFIKNFIEEVKPQIRRLNLEIDFNEPQLNLPQIYIDKQKIYIVLSNILDNAVKYNVQNGKIFIWINTSQDNKFIEIAIKDTGVGIFEKDFKNLFKKFFRSEVSQKINTEGSGLGLYITKKIIENHGGKIKIESEQNRGTTVIFSLPIDPKLIPGFNL